MVLREVIEHARRKGIRRLVGAYRPTEKNKLVEDHYRNLGFTHIGTADDASTWWELDVETAEVKTAPMVVRSLGFDIPVQA
jgi:predicted enzyme involved in methoxymalonyl-ACP biosynthesis